MEARAFLDGELVERQMVGGEVDRPMQLSRPRLGVWPGRA
jgi:hypothetical protein